MHFDGMMIHSLIEIILNDSSNAKRNVQRNMAIQNSHFRVATNEAMNAELQLILDMSRRAEQAGKIMEFNEEAARLQYEDWNMSRIDAMREALIKVLDEK